MTAGTAGREVHHVLEEDEAFLQLESLERCSGRMVTAVPCRQQLQGCRRCSHSASRRAEPCSISLRLLHWRRRDPITAPLGSECPPGRSWLALRHRNVRDLHLWLPQERLRSAGLGAIAASRSKAQPHLAVSFSKPGDADLNLDNILAHCSYQKTALQCHCSDVWKCSPDLQPNFIHGQIVFMALVPRLSASSFPSCI